MRRLIICNDGTWNSPDDKDRGKTKPTNVTKLSRAINPVDEQGVSQIVFYHEGVGTGFGQKVLGGVTGFGISENILHSYRFLSHNYEPGDEIFMFGFSRGAYTSRSLIGLITKIGLVDKNAVFYLDSLYDLYKKDAPAEEVEALYTDHKIERHQPRIKMVGVFDTVGALGLPLKPLNRMISGLKIAESSFHNVELSPIIDNAYHALSIDEQRKPFAPSMWGTPIGDMKMEQRWFAGVHSNIGGGYNPDSLANFTLHYIVEKAKECGLSVDQDYLKYFRSWVKTEIRHSMSLKYRVMGRNVRQISLGDGSNQVVDDSVYEKMKEDEKYKPKNVPPSDSSYT